MRGKQRERLYNLCIFTSDRLFIVDLRSWYVREIILKLDHCWALPLALICVSKCVCSLGLARENSLIFCLLSYSDNPLPIFCLCDTVLFPYIICNYIYRLFCPIILLEFRGLFYLFFFIYRNYIDLLFLELGNLKVNGIYFITLSHFLWAFMSWFLHPAHLYISLYLSQHIDIWNA